MIRRHHFLLLALAIVAVLVAVMTFKARQAAGQAIDGCLPYEEGCTKYLLQKTGQFACCSAGARQDRR